MLSHMVNLKMIEIPTVAIKDRFEIRHRLAPHPVSSLKSIYGRLFWPPSGNPQDIFQLLWIKLKIHTTVRKGKHLFLQYRLGKANTSHGSRQYIFYNLFGIVLMKHDFI